MHPRSRPRLITTRFAISPLANCSGCRWRHAEPSKDEQPFYKTLEAFKTRPAIKKARETQQEIREEAAAKKRKNELAKRDGSA